MLILTWVAPLQASQKLISLVRFPLRVMPPSYFDDFKSGNLPTVQLSLDESGSGKLVVAGQLDVRDTTKGITSLKAYQGHLADEITNHIVQNLQSQ